MDYSKAKSIRGKSLTDMMLSEMETSGITKSVGKVVSKKIQAKATGIKEKFDPLNIVKFVTGGSKLATGIAGKLTGRSQADIDYFTGRKSNKRNVRTATAIQRPIGSSFDSTATQLLNQIYDFMVKTKDEDKEIRQIERSFQEEKENEKEKKHKEFVSTLKEFVEKRSEPEIRVIGQKEPGVLEKISDMLGSFASGVKSFISSIGSFVTNLFEFLAKTVIAKMLLSFFNKIKGWLESGLIKIFAEVTKSIFKLMTTNIWKILSKAIGIGGSLLATTLRFLANPVTLAIIVALVAGYAALKALEYTDNWFTGHIEEKTKELTGYLKNDDALEEQKRKFNPDGTLNESWLRDKKNIQMRIDRVNGELSQLYSDFELKKELEAKGVNRENIKEKLREVSAERELNLQKESIDTESDTLDLNFKDIINRNLLKEPSDVTPTAPEVDEILKNAPKLELMNIPSRVSGMIDENVSLSRETMFGENDMMAGTNIINQTNTTPPTIKNRMTPVTAKVRDDTPIFKRAFGMA